MTRAVSTAIDVAVALLLVSAAVGVLVASGTGPPPVPDAGPPAETLATATVSVTYSPGTEQPHGRAGESGRVVGPGSRRARGTLADLLGDAAVENVTLGGTEVTRIDGGFEAAVRRAVANATGRRTAVRATWAPYPGAPVGGVVRAGHRPPPQATVGSVTVTVDSGCPPVATEARRVADEGGFDAVARVVSRAVIRCLFPPRRTVLALVAGDAGEQVTGLRYRRFAALTGAELADAIDRGDVRRANARLTRALADRLAADMRQRFSSPRAAARAVDVATVRVVVRRWD